VNRVNESFYQTNPVTFPEQTFELYVDGVDSGGDVFRKFLTQVVKNKSENDEKGEEKFHEAVEGSDLTLNCNSKNKKAAKRWWNFNGSVLLSDGMR
jgi:hypothetical protein